MITTGALLSRAYRPCRRGAPPAVQPPAAAPIDVPVLYTPLPAAEPAKAPVPLPQPAPILPQPAAPSFFARVKQFFKGSK